MPEQGYDEVGRHEIAFLVHEHHPVRISVVYDSGIRARLLHEILERNHVVVDERIRFVVREAAVHGVEDIIASVPENILGKQAGHAVGQVESHFQLLEVIGDIFPQEGQVVPDLFGIYLSFLLRRNDFNSFVYPRLDLAETAVEADRKGVFPGDLEAVVLGRIV